MGWLHSGHHNERQGFSICGYTEKGAQSMWDKGWIQTRRSGFSNGTEPGCCNLYDLVFILHLLPAFFLHFINCRLINLSKGLLNIYT